MSEIDILLVYPRLGSQDTVLRDIPLSLLYAAAHSVKNGYQVEILDCRLYPRQWKAKLDAILQRGCSLVGLSVMTGYPITTSLEISQYVRDTYKVPVVWGGPHPTILPEQTLANPHIDFIIRDWGSEPLCQLISSLKGRGPGLEEIVGLGFKKNGRRILNPSTCQFEILDYRSIPYHLVDIDAQHYNRLQGAQCIFPIYTAVGCPYKCAFCMSPSVYGKIKGKKWIPLPVDDVIGHIEYLLEKYRFDRLQIYDDDSFVELDRMRDFFTRYLARGFESRLRIDFRGVRINELDRMDNAMLELMVKARVEIMAIGVESGSDDTLKRMNKGITVDQILRVNRRLSQYPSMIPHYNILCGTPGETYEDLVRTKDLMVRLVEENPACLVGSAGDWKPYPGSAMTEAAVRNHGLKLPQTLREWARIDSLDADKIVHPWYSRKIDNYIKLLQIAGMVLDQKAEMVSAEARSRWSILNVLSWIARLYRPILSFRLRHNLSSLLIEYPLRTHLMKLIGRIYDENQLKSKP
jgi:anaerobic magnesium-protoporphyrin IX monomethyl ester cyclase